MLVLGIILGIVIIVGVMTIAYRIESNSIWIDENDEYIEVNIFDKRYLFYK